MKCFKHWMSALFVLGLFSCEQISQLSLNTDKSRYSYAVGYQFAKNMKVQNIEIDNEALSMAIKDVMKDKKARLTEEEMQMAMKAMYERRKEREKIIAEENKKKGDEFLNFNKTKEGVKTTESGLQYKIESKGNGPQPKKDSFVTVHYKGTLIDGKEFDSSYGRGQPATFPVRGVIPGWQEALKMMKKGAKWKLYIPSELAYKDRSHPGIPGNSVLVFDVELLDITTADAQKGKVKKAQKKNQKKAKAQ